MRTFGQWWTIAAAALLPLPATGAMQPSPPAAQSVLEQFRELVAEMRATMLRPGERVPSWNVGGANPDADLRARGADRYYMLSRGDDGDSVSILTSRPIAEIAPADWQVVDSYGSSATPLDSPQVDFTAVSARYVFAIRSQFRRRGGADCSAGITNALLYEVPDAPAGDGDGAIPLMFRALILALEGQELCVRSDGDAARGYRSRVFLPDGRLLPEMSDDDVSTIVPAAPVDRLVTWRAPTPAASPGGAMQPDLIESEAALLDQLVAALRARLEPGERVPGWDVGGADIDAELRALGAESHYMLSHSHDGDDVSILTDRPIAAFAPAAWRVVDTFGSAATPLDQAQVNFTASSPRYVIGLRVPRVRRGGASCSLGITDAVLYEVPGAPEGEIDDVIPLLFRAANIVFGPQELCARAEGNSATGYRARIFLPDGRLLPALRGENEVARIVPAAPIDRLVTWRAPERDLIPED